MIDEIDLRLHPRWQARILEDLVRIFPNVQFIVTTHSPVVVASVPRGNIRILGEDAATVPAMETRGRDAGDILNTVLGASSRPEEAGRLFDLFQEGHAQHPRYDV
ncbi:MAG: AAA family ATPase [Collinsella sp.]